MTDRQGSSLGSPSSSGIPASIVTLFDPATIRQRCQNIFAAVHQGQSTYFELNMAKLPLVSQFVADECRLNYPDGNIPIHGRMRHFEMDHIDRIAALKEKLLGNSLDKAICLADLVMVSVLLDAGAGASWKYLERTSGKTYVRSEGLALASLDYFSGGGFSTDGKSLRVDAARLMELTVADLERCLQLSASNRVVGLEGRLSLLKNLGRAITAAPQVYGQIQPRPGNIIQSLHKQKCGDEIPAALILQTLLSTLSAIWPGRLTRQNFSLGDVWEHPKAGGNDLTTGLVPFHKLSQWLSYSLVEPCMEAGLTITNLDALTGLPEYRNGGLFFDMGVILPKNTDVITSKHRPQDELIVEWRALTVVLLDQLSIQVRQILHKTAAELPQANILQGGTWSAGRRIAKTLRPDGSPPIQLDSDGTVF